MSGTAELARHTTSQAIGDLSALLFGLLLVAVVTALVNTVRGTVSGRLLSAGAGAPAGPELRQDGPGTVSPLRVPPAEELSGQSVEARSEAAVCCG